MSARNEEVALTVVVRGTARTTYALPYSAMNSGVVHCEETTVQGGAPDCAVRLVCLGPILSPGLGNVYTCRVPECDLRFVLGELVRTGDAVALVEP